MIPAAPIVVLDACVLYPAGLRSLMMWLAVHEVIRPRWSEQIHDEWMRNVLRDRPDLTREKLERTRRLMDANAGDCLVVDFEQRIATLSLPDPDDRHVVAAAIETQADAIITWNLSDFPSLIIAEYGIDVQTPDQLITGLLESAHSGVVAAMKEHRSTLKNPPRSPASYMKNLEQQGLTKTARLLHNHLDQL
jgi:predicted nucleic acid-binding protein